MVYINGLSKITPFNTRKFAQNSACGLENAQNGSFSYIGNALITDRDFSNVQGLKSPHFGNNFAFQAQQVVYAGGAINAGIKLAELGKQQAEVGVKLTRQQIRFRKAMVKFSEHTRTYIPIIGNTPMR